MVNPAGGCATLDGTNEVAPGLKEKLGAFGLSPEPFVLFSSLFGNGVAMSSQESPMMSTLSIKADLDTNVRDASGGFSPAEASTMPQSCNFTEAGSDVNFIFPSCHYPLSGRK